MSGSSVAAKLPPTSISTLSKAKFAVVNVTDKESEVSLPLVIVTHPPRRYLSMARVFSGSKGPENKSSLKKRRPIARLLIE